MKNKICNYLTTLLPETTSGQFLALLETPPESAMGDFALPCFSFAKVLNSFFALPNLSEGNFS